MGNITSNSRTQRFIRWSKWMWGILFFTLAITILSFVVLYFFTPSFKELEDPNYSLASEILASNGKVLGRYYTENRVPVPYDSLNRYLVQALIATEDERFAEHAGIDGRALARVVYGVLTLNPQGGGSTITQQLAKLLYTRRDFSGMSRWQKPFALVYYKFYEWITAIKLERNYTKEEIIAMYLNQYDFVNNACGIKSASETYFNKPQKDLKIHEAALLIGMLNNASLFNPVRRPERSLLRRNEVLAKMQRNGIITETRYNSLKKLPLDIVFKAKSYDEGLATYFRVELAEYIKKVLDKDEYRKPDGTKYDIYNDGLKIYTTIDYEMQSIGEQSMKEHMAALQKHYWQVWKGRDPWSYREKETTDQEIKTRKNALEKLIRKSARYEMLRVKQLEEVIRNISTDLDTEVSDSDIDKMLEEDSKVGYLNKIIKDGTITNKKAAQLRLIMESKYWTDLKSKWRQLQTDVKVAFSKPTKMKVFAYNDKNQKDTIMTPLDSIRYHRMFMQLGSMAVDPTTGNVKMWVGGINHKYFQFDHVTADRQVGSTFKPFIYATAIAQQGISPCFPVTDNPQTIRVGEGSFHLAENWTPKNAKGYSGRNFSLFEGLKESVNTVSVFLMKQIGNTEAVRGLVNEMGIDSSAKYPNGKYKLPKQPSICLGSCDLTVQQMTGAYTTFANQGVYNKPIFLLRIEDKNGKTIYEETPHENKAMNPNANYVMLQMLKYVAAGAPGLGGLKSEIGGKTGTTNDFVDGWFMGVTPRLVVGTWVGGEDRWIRFLDIADGQGAKMARPFFAKLMQKVESSGKTTYDSTPRFIRPPGDIGIEIDCAKYNNGTTGTDGGDFGDGDRFSDEAAPPKKSDDADFGDDM